MLDVPGTLRGFRTWVITDCPVAPGLRPGHVAQLEAVRREAGKQIAAATGQRDDAVEHASAHAQLRGERDRLAAELRAATRQPRQDNDGPAWLTFMASLQPSPICHTGA